MALNDKVINIHCIVILLMFVLVSMVKLLHNLCDFNQYAEKFMFIFVITNLISTFI
jgi:hypothetical protein